MACGAPAHADVNGPGSCQEGRVFGGTLGVLSAGFAEQMWLLSAAFTAVLSEVAKLWQFISSLPCNLKLWCSLM